MKREELAEELTYLQKKVEYGCGNHGCEIRPIKKGQLGTNAICNCKRNIPKLLKRLAELLEKEGIE